MTRSYSKLVTAPVRTSSFRDAQFFSLGFEDRMVGLDLIRPSEIFHGTVLVAFGFVNLPPAVIKKSESWA